MYRRTRGLIVTALAATLVLSCGSDDDEEPSATDGGTADADAPSETEAPPGTDPPPQEPPFAPAPGCLHDPTIVLVSIDDQTDLVTLDEAAVDANSDAVALDEVALAARLGPSNADFAPDVLGRVRVYAVPDGLPPDPESSPAISLARDLSAIGYEAAPLLVMGFSGHWGFAPGADARPVQNPASVEYSQTVGGNPIVVIDTGYLSSTGAVLPGVTSAGDGDDESAYEFVPDAYIGHGTFIASVLRQEAPFPVVQYRLPATTSSVVKSSNEVLEVVDGAEGSFPHGSADLLLSDELQFLATTLRAVSTTSATDDDAPFILNVSSGAYPCEDDRDDPGPGAVGARAAVEAWIDGPDDDSDAAADGEPACRIVVASAGNGGTEGTFVPADYPDVIGVEATEQTSGRALRAGFSNDGDVRAPGVDLIGLRGTDAQGAGEFVAWSGTSFAAPVVAAQVASDDVCRDPSAYRDADFEASEVALDKRPAQT